MSCTPQELATDLGCWLNLDASRLQAIILRLLCAIRDGETMSCDPQTLANEAACIQSCMSPQMVLAAQVKLLCELTSTIASRGYVICSDTDTPPEPAVDGCYLHYSTVDGSTRVFMGPGNGWA